MDDQFVEPVNDENDWYVFETTVVAKSESLTLTIQNDSDLEGGDSTLLVDNVFFGQDQLLGDFDNDGEITPDDINLFASTDEAGIEEINATLAQLGFINGDLDLDGEVAFADFLVLSNNFGGSEFASWTDGDLDGDGKVAFSDFLVLSDNFGSAAAQVSNVPEPSFASLLVSTLLLVSLSRYRINTMTT